MYQPMKILLLKNVLANISAYEWVVLTSRNGVDIFIENMKKIFYGYEKPL